MRNRTKYIGRTALVAGGLVVLGGLGSTASAAVHAPSQPDPLGGLLSDAISQGAASGEGQAAPAQDADVSSLSQLLAGLEGAPVNQRPEKAVVNNDSGRIPLDPKPPIEFLDGAIGEALTNELFKKLGEQTALQDEVTEANATGPQVNQQPSQQQTQSAQGGQQTQQNTSQPQQQATQQSDTEESGTGQSDTGQPGTGQSDAGQSSTQQQPGRPPATTTQKQQPDPQPVQEGQTQQQGETGQQGLTESLGEFLPGGSMPTDGLPLNLGKNTVTPFF